MKFSDRIGATTPKSIIQLNGMDKELRISLWNYFLEYIWEAIICRSPDSRIKAQNAIFFTKKILAFLKIPMDQTPEATHLCLSFLKKSFLQSEWYEPYNLLEEIIRLIDLSGEDLSKRTLNKALEREGSGYRFIENKFVPISEKMEVKEIETVLGSKDESSIHIKAAIDALAKKENTDYRNCIKEAISAVEATARQLAGGTTNLRKALGKLEKNGVVINGRFKDAMGKLYDYTNDQDTGIRHCLMNGENPPKYEEAKYMLVVCSAFVNLLKGWDLKNS